MNKILFLLEGFDEDVTSDFGNEVEIVTEIAKNNNALLSDPVHSGDVEHLSFMFQRMTKELAQVFILIFAYDLYINVKNKMLTKLGKLSRSDEEMFNLVMTEFFNNAGNAYKHNFKELPEWLKDPDFKSFESTVYQKGGIALLQNICDSKKLVEVYTNTSNELSAQSSVDFIKHHDAIHTVYGVIGAKHITLFDNYKGATVICQNEHDFKFIKLELEHRTVDLYVFGSVHFTDVALNPLRATVKEHGLNLDGWWGYLANKFGITADYEYNPEAMSNTCAAFGKVFDHLQDEI